MDEVPDCVRVEQVAETGPHASQMRNAALRVVMVPAVPLDEMAFRGWDINRRTNVPARS